MDGLLETLAFALLIAAQLLAVIAVNWTRWDTPSRRSLAAECHLQEWRIGAGFISRHNGGLQ